MMDHVEGYYRADRWSKKHPVFDGLPSGGMMDYKFYRNIISKYALSQEYVIPGKAAHTDEEISAPLTYPSEAVCCATRISHTYCSGIHLGIWDMGQGKFIVNTLNIAENLDRDPAADRLFYNLLRYASENTGNSEVNMHENIGLYLQKIAPNVLVQNTGKANYYGKKVSFCFNPPFDVQF